MLPRTLGLRDQESGGDSGTRNAVHADPVCFVLPLDYHRVCLFRDLQNLELSVGIVLQLVMFHAAIVQV